MSYAIQAKIVLGPKVIELQWGKHRLDDI